MTKNDRIKMRAQFKYEADGAEAVYDYAKELGIKDWRECSGCEAETPHLDGECLICGQKNKA